MSTFKKDELMLWLKVSVLVFFAHTIAIGLLNDWQIFSFYEKEFVLFKNTGFPQKVSVNLYPRILDTVFMPSYMFLFLLTLIEYGSKHKVMLGVLISSLLAIPFFGITLGIVFGPLGMMFGFMAGILYGFIFGSAFENVFGGPLWGGVFSAMAPFVGFIVGILYDPIIGFMFALTLMPIIIFVFAFLLWRLKRLLS